MRFESFFMCVFPGFFLLFSSCEFLKQDSPQTPAHLQKSRPSTPPLAPFEKPPSLPNQNPALQVSNPDNPVNAVCDTDTDCVLVNKGCCTCSAGGESIAIHKSKRDSYISELKESCYGYYSVCAQQYLCDSFKAECQNSQCVTVRQ